MAAGLSTRYGRTKQLLKLKGKPLLEWTLDACLNSQLEKIVLVIGHDAHRIITALSSKLEDSRILTTINRRYREGMSQSLRSGLLKAMNTFPSVMFLLGDQPMVDSRMINRLLNNFWKSDKDICIPVYKGKRGNPSIFSQYFYDQLLNIQGDIGARKLILNNPENVLSVDVESSMSFFDIDTEKDLNILEVELE